MPKNTEDILYLTPDGLQAIPGVVEYSGARIQLLDLPGIVEGASQGRGRGRQVVAGMYRPHRLAFVLIHVQLPKRLT